MYRYYRICSLTEEFLNYQISDAEFQANPGKVNQYMQVFCKCTVNSVRRCDTDCVVEPAQDSSCLGKQTVAIRVWERISTIRFLNGAGFGCVT